MKELAQQLRGQVLEPAPEAYARDFSNMQRVVPLAVIEPLSVEDVQATVAYAFHRGLRAVPRGHACSTRGQTLCEQLVLDMRGLTELELVEPHVVRAGPGWGWGALQEALVARGLSNPVLTGHEYHTVGGTLGVGGYGSASIHRGGQVDQVLALDVVTGKGEVLHARRGGPNEDLFHYTLCGLGQTGIIVRAYLKVLPYKPVTVLSVTEHGEAESLRDITRRVIDDAQAPWDHCLLLYYTEKRRWFSLLGHDVEHAPAEPRPGTRAVPHYFRQQYRDSAAAVQRPLDALVKAGLLQRAEDARQLWVDYFLPAGTAPLFAEKLQALFPDPLFTRGSYGAVLRTAPESPRLPLSPVPLAEVVNTFSGPFCTLPPSHVEDYRARFDQATEHCLALGGRVYLYGWHPRSAGFYRRQFGPKVFEEWQATKARHDPGGILGAPLF
jgi:cytokinin dehydrogenase